MPNTLVPWPEIEVEKSGSSGSHEIRLQFNKAKTRSSAPRAADARLGDALLERHRIRSASHFADAASFLFHAVLIGTLFLVPLLYTEALNVQQYNRTLLVGPPPPPPPPPTSVATVKATSASRKSLFSDGKLLAPVVIPKQVAILKEQPLPADTDLGGVAGGVPGGVPGGQLGGVLGGILGGIPTSVTKAPAPPPEKVHGPIRVGGHIRPPRRIYTPDPNYPPLAKQARIQGDVVIDAVIDKTGSVVEMKVVSGPSLLVPAALAAVRTWKFEPTYLNEQPIEVEFILTVHFQLQNQFQ